MAVVHVQRSTSWLGRGAGSRWPTAGMVASAVVAAVAACGPGGAGDTGSEAPAADAAWLAGPRDSARAVALACALVRDFPGGLGAGSCHLEAYEEAPAEYVLRVRETLERPSERLRYSRSEVRLSKDGRSATLLRLHEP